MPEFGSPHSNGAAEVKTVSSEFTSCLEICVPDCCPHNYFLLQKSEAERILIEAVSAANNGATGGDVAVLQQKMAHLCIRNGLKPLAHGFQLEPIQLHKFGMDAALKAAKRYYPVCIIRAEKAHRTPSHNRFLNGL